MGTKKTPSQVFENAFALLCLRNQNSIHLMMICSVVVSHLSGNMHQLHFIMLYSHFHLMRIVTQCSERPIRMVFWLNVARTLFVDRFFPFFICSSFFHSSLSFWLSLCVFFSCLFHFRFLVVYVLKSQWSSLNINRLHWIIRDH